MRKTRKRLWLVASAALAAAACTRDARPDLLLVTLDTTRADRIGVMGDAEARTPTLDALAASGVLFERAFASAPRTLPSHATMLTGLEPFEHGVHDNGAILPADVGTVTERLAARGYATAAFVAAFVLDASFGLARGFGTYDDEIDWERSLLDVTVPQRPGEQVTEQALAWLAQRPKQPFFLWVHYYDPHAPRQPLPPFDDMADAYAAEIAYTDAQLGRLLEGARRASGERGLVILVAGDHGEALGEHDEATHGILAYDATLHVPLIAAGPGFPAGTRSEAFAQTRDVAPTLLAAAGEAAGPASGALALQALASARKPVERTGYFESAGAALAFGWGWVGGARDARWKLTVEPAPQELYDVAADPDESANRIDAEPAVVDRLSAAYTGMRHQGREPQPAELAPEVRERLDALGYVAAPVRFEGAAPDPRRLVGTLGWIDRARALASEGRVADAIRALEIIASHPAARNVALNTLAPVYLAAGRNDDAAGAYAELLERTRVPGLRTAWAVALLEGERPQEALDALGPAPGASAASGRRAELARAEALLALGRPDEALAHSQAQLAANPADDEARALRSRARAAREGAAAEIERLQGELASEPDAARALETRAVLARLLSEEGRDAEAARALEAIEPPPPAYLALRAEIAAKQGNPERAAALYGEALAQQPHAHAWLFELAHLYRELGRLEDALAIYAELAGADPESAPIQLDRGVALFAAKRWDEAAASFGRAAALDAELAEAWFNLALVDLEQGREREAEQNLTRAVGLRPDYAKAHLQLAMLYKRRGDSRAGHHAEQAAASAGKMR